MTAVTYQDMLLPQKVKQFIRMLRPFEADEQKIDTRRVDPEMANCLQTSGKIFFFRRDERSRLLLVHLVRQHGCPCGLREKIDIPDVLGLLHLMKQLFRTQGKAEPKPRNGKEFR